MAAGFAIVVSSEEFANKIIETGVSGLKNIAEDVRNVGGRTANRIEVPPRHSLRFVISLDEELSVFRIGIVRDCQIESVEMMTRPAMLSRTASIPILKS